MKTKLIYDGETIPNEEGFPSGMYWLGRSANRGVLAIAGEMFGKRGTIIGNRIDLSLTRLLFAEDSKIVRAHLIMEVGDREVKLTDVMSTNGSYINGNQFREETLRELGDYRIKLGKGTEFRLLLTE